MARYNERRDWILEFMRNRGSEIWQQTACTFDEAFHDAYYARFGGKFVVYTLGPCRSPNANRTLRQMWKNGELKRSTIGNQEARAYCQPTYSFIYRMPHSDRGFTFEEYEQRKRGSRRIRFSRGMHKRFK